MSTPSSSNSRAAPSPQTDEQALKRRKLDHASSEGQDEGGAIRSHDDQPRAPCKPSTPAPGKTAVSGVRKRLSQPFRSPLVKGQTADENQSPRLSTTSHSTADAPKSGAKAQRVINYGRPGASGGGKDAARGANGSLAGSASAISDPSKRKEAELEELQQRLRLLKQAVKYQSEADEKPLQECINLWRAKGQEAATELFSKIPAPDLADTSAATGTGFAQSWGWSDAPQQQAPPDAQDAAEEGLKADADAEPAEPKELVWNVGCMLDKFGLPKALLHWDDEGEDFA